MKLISRPSSETADILDACIEGIEDDPLKLRFNTARTIMLEQFSAYERHAKDSNLYLFNPCRHGDPSQVVISELTKGELKELYTKHMVGSTKSGRKFYDSLMMLAHFGKCPYCGFGQASKLDHFLPKARYPLFSVLGLNLVPACTDCNNGKGAPVAKECTQTLHPYFEDKVIETTPWLFSKVIESSPATVEYFVNPPADWSVRLKGKISNHFNSFELSKRFSVEAASEISGLSYHLDGLKTVKARQAHLSTKATIERRIHTNSWQAALYEALANNSWYQQHGFKK